MNPTRTKRLPYFVTLFLLAFVLVGYVVYPLTSTIAESLQLQGEFSLAHYAGLLGFGNSANLEAVWNSVWVSLLSVVCSGVVGILLACVFTQLDFPFRGFLSKLAVLPIALPPLVGVIAFLFVFGESGFLPKLLQALLRAQRVPFYLDGVSAIVAVHAYSFNVYFFLFVSSALRQIDASVLEASANLGSSTWRTFRRIVLPELRPALAGASVLTFMTSMASFSAPFLFGGDRRFMTLQIYISKLNGATGIASAQAIGLTLVSLLFFVALRHINRSTGSGMRTKGASRAGMLQFSKPARLTLLAVGSSLLLIELLPFVTILFVSFAKEGSWTWQMLPTGYTTENYAKLLSEPHVFDPIRNSVLMASLTVVAAVLVGVPTAYLTTKGGLKKSKFLLEVVSTLPFAIPGTVVGLGLILAFSSPSVFSGFTVLTGTFWILPLAYFVREFPLVVRSTSAALEKMDDSLVEAGEVLGAGAARRFRKIVLPLILPGIASGSLLVMIAALGEFVSSILLYTYSNRPIAIEILSQMRGYNFGAAAAYSVVVLGFILLLTYLASLVSNRSTDGGERFNF